jgi:hypothetical protein
MNGPEHYREAESALRYAWSGEASDAELSIATAQVHATLALTAANAPGAQRCSHWADITRPSEATADGDAVAVAQALQVAAETIADLQARVNDAEGRADRLQEKVAGLETGHHLRERVRAELDHAVRVREAVAGDPSQGPYPGTVDEVASEVVTWLHEMGSTYAQGLPDYVRDKLQEKVAGLETRLHLQGDWPVQPPRVDRETPGGE